MMQKSRPQDGFFVCGIRRLRLFHAPKRQNPGALSERPGFWTLLHKEPDDYLLSHGQSALSSAWSCFTVLFGMGRGGTSSLWSSGMTGCCVARVRVNLAPQPIGKKRKEVLLNWGCVVSGTTRDLNRALLPSGAGCP